MTQAEIQESSKKKLDKLMKLAEELQLTCQSKQQVNLQTGIIENVVFWTDNEKYPVFSTEQADARAAEKEPEEAQKVESEDVLPKVDLDAPKDHA